MGLGGASTYLHDRGHRGHHEACMVAARRASGIGWQHDRRCHGSLQWVFPSQLGICLERCLTTPDNTGVHTLLGVGEASAVAGGTGCGGGLGGAVDVGLGSAGGALGDGLHRGGGLGALIVVACMSWVVLVLMAGGGFDCVEEAAASSLRVGRQYLPRRAKRFCVMKRTAG